MSVAVSAISCAIISSEMSGRCASPGLSSHSDSGGWKCTPLGAGSRKPTSAACDGGTPNARRNARENTSGADHPSSSATAATPSPRCSRQAARSSITRRRNAAGGSPVSRLTSREKWNSEAKLLRAIPATSVFALSTTESRSSRSRSRRGPFG